MNVDPAALRLIRPHRRFRRSMLAMMDEFRAAGEDRYDLVYDFAARRWREFVDWLLKLEQDPAPAAPPSPPCTTFWAITPAGEVVGESRFRHRLTSELEIEGGHVGYAVRPAARGRGVGTRMLALTLAEVARAGLSRVLITCNTDNLASARIILRHGGVRDGESLSPHTGLPVSRYWVPVSPPR